MCFGLRSNSDVKDGQIAHIGRDRSSVQIDDLGYLFLECHKIMTQKAIGLRVITQARFGIIVYNCIGHLATTKLNLMTSESTRV